MRRRRAAARPRPVEEARHDRVRRVGPGPARRRDDLGGQDGGVVLAWHGAVAPRPADGDPVGGVALLGDLDRVEPPAGDRRRHAAALVERTGRAQPVRAVVDDPRGAGRPARLLVGRAGEQDVAAQAGDRVAGRVEAGGARPVGQQPDDARAPSRPCPSCRPRRGRRRSRRRGRRRTGRASSAPPAPARRRGAEQEQEGLAAGSVAAEAGVDRSHGRGPARRSPGARPASSRRPARCRAAISSPSGASGGGGLTERIRIRSRSVSTSRSVRGRPDRRVELARRGASSASSRGAGEEDAEDDPDDEPAEDERRPPWPGAGVRRSAPRAGRPRDAGPDRRRCTGRPGRGRGRAGCEPRRRRRGPAAAAPDGRSIASSPVHHAAEWPASHHDGVRHRCEPEPCVDGSHRGVVQVVAGLERVEPVRDRPADRGLLERPGDAAAAPVASDRGHVVPGDGPAAGHHDQAGVPDRSARGRVERDHERLRRNARPVDVARTELGEIAGRVGLVPAGNVRERLERHRVDRRDQVGPLRQGGQPDPGRDVDTGRRETRQVEPDHLVALVLGEAAMDEERDTLGAGVAGRDVEPSLAGVPGAIRDGGQEIGADASSPQLGQDGDRRPQAVVVGWMHVDPADRGHADRTPVQLGHEAGRPRVGGVRPVQLVDRGRIVGGHDVDDADDQRPGRRRPDRARGSPRSTERLAERRRQLPRHRVDPIRAELGRHRQHEVRGAGGRRVEGEPEAVAARSCGGTGRHLEAELEAGGVSADLGHPGQQLAAQLAEVGEPVRPASRQQEGRDPALGVAGRQVHPAPSLTAEHNRDSCCFQDCFYIRTHLQKYHR